MYKNSKIYMHISLFVISMVIFLVVEFFNVEVDPKNMEFTLSGIAIISAFFILTLSNMNFSYLNSRYKREVRITKTGHIPESAHVRSKVFSLSISAVLLTGVSFVLNLFSINFFLPLVWSLLYLFVGVIYTLLLWNLFASKEDQSEKEAKVLREILDALKSKENN